ncbi:MAG: YqaJ viral recombinase family protein [Phycisphaerales bacterium]|nr:YqaJ viral recombinase family protein [Phycisphaerales bacterium]
MSAVLANVGDVDRRTYLGGSDAAAILGLDPYGKTPLTVYLAKRGELVTGAPDPEREKFLRRRKRWEEPIVAMLREEFGGEIVAMNGRYKHPEHDFLAAEIDFEWADADGVIQNGEIKTVSPFAFNEGAGWGEAGTADVPIHYHAQVMHGLAVTGRSECILAALAGLDTMVFYRIERDEEAIADLRAAEVAFWTDHVLAGVPPEPITMADVGRLWNRRNGRPVEIDEDTAGRLEHLRQARGEQKALDGDVEELQLEIAKAICKAWGVADGEEAPEDHAILTYQGRKVAYLGARSLNLARPEAPESRAPRPSTPIHAGDPLPRV